tara:strand:- start:483 stop:683 length:201 start_codon:yes stop_codon:yes gene_type:complete
MIVGKDDEMIHCNRDVQRAVFDRIAGEKEFTEIQGGHFGLLWQSSAQFDEAIKQQINFLTRVLLSN